MLDNFFSSSDDRLPPDQQLEQANLYLKNAQNAQNQTNRALLLVLCKDADTALSQIKRPAKKALITSVCAEEQTLHDGIASAYRELGKLFEGLKCSKEAKASFKNALKWDHLHPGYSHPGDEHRVIDPNPLLSSATDNSNHGIARVPETIFPDDTRQPIVKCPLPLPEIDGRFKDTSQLVYCLGLLQARLSPDEVFERSAGEWVQTAENNPEEKQRIQLLATDLIRAFKHDELKDDWAVAEVVSLASVLESKDFRHLLMLFVEGINQSGLLNFGCLEGLAQLILSAPSGYLDSDDLVSILNNLNARLQATHVQSPDHIYHLTVAVSNVLDAMADTKVSGLKRTKLHEPLSVYLNGLLKSSDPDLVYQAAYALQALQCVPDDEPPWQVTKRRAGVLLKGTSGMVSAVKGLDINGFIEALGHLQDGLGDVYKAVKIGYKCARVLLEGGEGLLESVKVGLIFNRKRAWYTALRGTDTLIRDGQLAKFRTLVCEAPCRRDEAFQLGVCQRLGKLATNTQWDVKFRQGAIAFLGEIYQSDAEWGQYSLVKRRIIRILVELSSISGLALLGVESLLLDFESKGDKTKMTLYQKCRKEDASPLWLKAVLPSTSSLSLLDRIQKKPEIEVHLRRLKKQCLERGNAVYIPPQAKANLQASDDQLFSLADRVQAFLESEDKVMLLLGNSGGGKSTFNQQLEYNLWDAYKKEDRIPLLINLPAIDKPEHDLVAKHLRNNNFTEAQIQEMKHHRKLVLICDGYDETQLVVNLYTSNQLNQPGQWRVQMVISCRSEYLPPGYHNRFQPMNRNHSTSLGLFQEAAIAPFSEAQIHNYIEQYVLTNRPVWKTKDYLKALDKIPSLQDLVKNPFLLTLSLEVLPRLMDQGQDILATRITRVTLYDHFVEQWLERGNKRLIENKDLIFHEKMVFQNLSNEGFAQSGVAFLKALAVAIYDEQVGRPVVEYLHSRDHRTWKEKFFSHEEEKRILREACPLTRNGSQYRFIHKSVLEYCLARAVFEPLDREGARRVAPMQAPLRRGSVCSVMSFKNQPTLEESVISMDLAMLDSPLARKSFVDEPSILQFLAERVQQESLFKQQLLATIEYSKTDKEAHKAAANAITILVRAGMSFIGADLKGIQIPGADLSGGQFDSAQLQGADLRKVKLRNIWLSHANLGNAQMAGTHFGEWPYLKEDGAVFSCAYSPDGKSCAMALGNATISVYDTSTWERTHILRDHADQVTSVVYSPNGQQIVSGSKDCKTRLWDAETGELGLILSDQTDCGMGKAYSPSSHEVASGIHENIVRLWGTEPGAPGFILSDDAHDVTSVAYSPSGHQTASGCNDKTVRLRDAETGALDLILHGHTCWVSSVAYSPSGQQIASGSYDRTVRLWDAETGVCGLILSGHTYWITSVAYSPSGHQVASGSFDMTVRLWDVETGALAFTLRDHISYVKSVAYSPSGHQIASGSCDSTVRLWDAKTGTSSLILSGHTGNVTTVAYSPSGHQIASGSDDQTVRLWDVQFSTPDLISSGHSRGVASVVHSTSGQQIDSRSAGGTAWLRDAQTDEPNPILSDHTGDVQHPVYSRSGQQIASVSVDGTVQLLDVHTGAPGPILRGHTRWVSCIAYSPSGRQIASGSYDETVRLWDAKTGAAGLILSGHTGKVVSVAYSPSGLQIASGSEDDTVRLWNAETGEQDFILSDHNDCVRSVAYSPSGLQIASGSHDSRVRLWDAKTGVCGRILSGHTDWVTSVAYSPIGLQIASASNDRTVRLWDVSLGQQLAVVEDFDAYVLSVDWKETPDGTYFVTRCAKKSVRQWQVIEEDGDCQVKLHCSSTHNALHVSNALMHNVQGLSTENIRLLEQRGCRMSEAT